MFTYTLTCMYTQVIINTLVGSYLATKLFIGNLPAMGRGSVIIKSGNDERRSTTCTNKPVT